MLQTKAAKPKKPPGWAGPCFQGALRGARGVAVFEMLFLLVVFMILVGITLGLWGAAHSAVLQSIAARHYAFEVINNRPHFEYFRDYTKGTVSGPGVMIMGGNKEEASKHYGKRQQMLFVVTVDDPDKFGGDAPHVATRGINFFSELKRGFSDPLPTDTIKPYKGQAAGFHAETWKTVEATDKGAQPANPIWLMTGYGICLETACGEN